MIKTILKKETKKQKIKEKKTNHVEEHCNNPQCFLRKATVVILNQLNIKKIKSTKIILEKIIKKNHVGKHYSNPQCFKEKNYKAKFSTNLILKK